MNIRVEKRTLSTLSVVMAAAAAAITLAGYWRADWNGEGGSRLEETTIANTRGLSPNWLGQNSFCVCEQQNLAAVQPGGNTVCSCINDSNSTGSDCLVCTDGPVAPTGFYTTILSGSGIQPNGGPNTTCSTLTMYAGTCVGGAGCSVAPNAPSLGPCGGDYPTFDFQTIAWKSASTDKLITGNDRSVVLR